MRRKDRQVTELSEIKKILDKCKVFRLGINQDNTAPYVVPLNYGYEFQDEKLVIYFHCSTIGKKLDLIQKNPYVGIEMNGDGELEEGKAACSYSYKFSSIMGSGKAEILENQEEKIKAFEIIMKHQTGKDFTDFRDKPSIVDKVGIVRIEVDEYTGKQHI
ncbi:MAG: pyridoxamine 5'-phosphate oxidase family protein [Lachnospiraceae bacterium]|jgi:nitroimidazol reductase NimA-like FMN-containing flavoprotein (pyridoxamine 5'-phosphate oxidase superfamily)|nr:pyridoxamine 5'-phosphate oxidase family protein [Lachnospiraceae bacterium]